MEAQQKIVKLVFEDEEYVIEKVKKNENENEIVLGSDYVKKIKQLKIKQKLLKRIKQKNHDTYYIIWRALKNGAIEYDLADLPEWLVSEIPKQVSFSDCDGYNSCWKTYLSFFNNYVVVQYYIGTTLSNGYEMYTYRIQVFQTTP